MSGLGVSRRTYWKISPRNVVDSVLRFTIRLTSEAWTHRFAAVLSLLGKNSLWLQSLADFNGLVEDAIDFPSFDPLDCIMELPEDIPSGVRCTEAFLYLAGDFLIKDGFWSHEAVLGLLHELNSPEGVLGMCCACPSEQGEAK